MQVRVAVVVSESNYGEEEYRNTERAVRYIAEAATAGAKLVCLPEGYPGPCTGPLDSGGRLPLKPIEAVQEAAKRHKIFVCAGNVEENPNLADTYFLTQKLISPEGEILANYKRVQPDHPILNAHLMGGRRHILPGDEPMAVPTELGNIGLLICSELWVPELARVEMLMGAEIIVAPVAAAGRTQRYVRNDTGQCIARARAAENLVYVLVARNCFPWQEGKAESWIAGPEEMVAIGEGPGVMVAELDLERLWYLRTRYYEEDMFTPFAEGEERRFYGCRPGQNHDRRPELYRKLVEPQPDAFDYFYWKKGLDTWPAEYERVRKCRPERPAMVATPTR